MKVLMFGWEFPPHITGGLGTACFGLSQSLASEAVDLTFVVPKMLSGEQNTTFKVCGAESVTIPFDESIINTSGKKKTRFTAGTHHKNDRIVSREVRVRRQRSSENFTAIEVESALIPYTTPVVRENTWTVETWNYVFEKTGTDNEAVTRGAVENSSSQKPKKPIGYRYSFKGGYGPRLMEEVKQYAIVARQLARTNKHDVIHAHDWMTFPAGVEARKASGKPLVIHIHATEVDRTGNSGGPIYDIEKEGMNAADRIIAVSNWTKHILINHYGISGEKISVVHNGVTATGLSKKKSNSAFGPRVVTFLGRITHQKGPRYFIEAAGKVAERFPDAHFIVAGSGDLLPQTIERVAQLRLSSRFHFTGFLDKEWIDRIWSISRVYVMPSVSEPFGITPLEAIQAGVPVIISNQSGVAEVMQNALKVDFCDTDALAEAICSVLKYESLSSMLKQRGEREVKSLSWQKAAQKIKNVYEEVTQ